MKKAFSLLEMIMALVIFTLLLAILSKPLGEFYRYHFKSLKENSLYLDLNTALLHIDKILSHCEKIEPIAKGLTCLFRDDENILNLDDKARLILQNSMLILEKNSHFYLPNSRLDELLKSRKALFNDIDKTLYFYANNQIQSFEVLNENNISLNQDFTGFFIPIQARIELLLQNEKIHYIIYPKITHDALKQESIIAENIGAFELMQKQNTNYLKLCLKEQDLCFEKRLYL